jgi:hypothetical protein
MILETAQLLSTAHRVLDGIETIGLSQTGRKKKVWQLPDDREQTLYSATHIHHPSAVWARYSAQNYSWLYSLLNALCEEYTYRYDKVHKCEQTGLVKALGKLPDNIHIKEFTGPTPAMPDDVKVLNDSINSYRNYYNKHKTHLASWKKRDVPEWYKGI